MQDQNGNDQRQKKKSTLLGKLSLADCLTGAAKLLKWSSFGLFLL